MAHIHPQDRTQIQTILGAGRGVVFLAAPARSALEEASRALSHAWRGAATNAAVLREIDLQRVGIAEALQDEIAAAFEFEGLEDGRSLLSRIGESPRSEPTLLSFTNAERAPRENLGFLIQLSLNEVFEHSSASVSFLIAGACDFEAEVARVFGGGPPRAPLFRFAEPDTPWRTIVEIEELIARVGATRLPRPLIAWIADVTGGDIGFGQEILMRIGDPTSFGEAELRTVLGRVVENGTTAGHLRTVASELDSNMLRSLVHGEWLFGGAPQVAPPELRDLYLAGIASYDPFLACYSIRGPMTAAALQEYPNFEKLAHPELAESLVVALDTFKIRFRDYREAANPPILHRKETFIGEDHPLFERFAKLTRQEERRGLYEYSRAIGTRQGWQEALAEKGLQIRGHRVIGTQ